MTPYWASGEAALHLPLYVLGRCYTLCSTAAPAQRAKGWWTCLHGVKRWCWNQVQIKKKKVKSHEMLHLPSHSGWLRCWTWRSGSCITTLFSSPHLMVRKRSKNVSFTGHFYIVICPVTWSCSVEWETYDFHLLVWVEVRSSHNVWYLY